jgi:uncharacterized protein YjbI with pentapeptide repeats
LKPFPIPVTAMKPLSCGSTLWRSGGVLRATIAVKISFGLAHDRVAWPTSPIELVREDRHREGPASSLADASEIAPYLPRAAVLLSGHACAPGGRPVPAMSVRLAMFRERGLLDKTLHVFGDRAAAAPASPRPFDRMPLVYEHAVSAEDNPVGVAQGAAVLPNILDARSPGRPAGFGPIARYWPTRKRLLGPHDRRRLEGTVVEVPEGFDFRWWNPAPPDQQIEHLRGAEWIVLDGLHPTLPRLQTRLPQVRARACTFLLGPSGPDAGRVLDLVADMLVIDADRQMASLVFRGHFRIDAPEILPHLRVFADVELPGNPIRRPDPAEILRAPAPAPLDLRPPAPPPPPSRPAEVEFETLSIRRDNVTAPQPVMPFGPLGAAPGAVKMPSPPPPPPPSRLPRSNDDDPLMRTRTVDVDELSARRVMPFASTSQPAPTPGGDDDPLMRTRSMSPEEAEAQLRAVMPFAVSPPAARPPPPRALPIPGAPFQPQGAPEAEPPACQHPSFNLEVPATEPGVSKPLESVPVGNANQPTAETLPPMVSPPPAMVSPPPAMVSPPAMVAPPAMIAPPPMISPPPAVAVPEAAAETEAAAESVPAVSAPLFVLGEPAPAPSAPAVDPALPPSAPPAPEEPPAPASVQETGLRATVLARLRVGEAPLHGLDATGADLRNLDFHGANLSGQNLGGAQLAGCNLGKARLSGARLVDADLDGADLTGADLTGADLSRASLARARLDGASLENANFSSARGPDASFDGARGRAAVFARGTWDGASFRAFDALRADFTGSSLDGAIFERAVLPDVKLDDVKGKGAVFDAARLEQAHAEGAALVDSSFRDLEGRGSNWEKATLTGSTFEGAKLESASFSRATCNGARFVRAVLRGTNLGRFLGDGADLEGADLEGADLRQARMHEARFDGANLQNILGARADLSRSRFVRADLGGASLRTALLGGANLAHARLDNADLRDADLKKSILHGASRTGAKMSGANTRDAIEHDPSLDS